MAVKAQGQITLSCVVDVKATYRYYLLQSSTLATPTKPTTFPPGSTWDDVEPTYVEGSTNSLYLVDCTVFCDDTFVYSEVSLSSSYEAAKAAYNKAVNAEGTANEALDNSEANATTISEIITDTAGISARVISLEKDFTTSNTSFSEQMTELQKKVELKLSAEDLTIRIESELANGVEKVVTGAGYTFDDTGLKIERDDSEMTTQITDNGMSVFQNEETVLTANNAGVDAKNLHATTYLIVGMNSRFEDYGNNRTGCFFIGG